ncbi:SRPBCC family protein [Nocardioides sp. BP30]|uniref:SRPBCC family protein n=1 Tax=Nocardioides sp. BP30 TaxID=3036374 RepID=UPI002469A882|nr:SRPBCC family protein [Nocardioides sp. BP30]WGL51699.1 SRPBCC family protein [Nocardioides sp. BP30]
MTRPYDFAERWTVPASPDRVREVLIDLEHYPQWWPQVVAVAKLGEDDAVVLCRSVLPYTLELRLHAISRELPTIEVGIGGHLEGYVRWTLTSYGENTELTWEQSVTVHGWLAPAATLGRPFLRWNHARMMAGGRAGLDRRLAAPPSPDTGAQRR